MKTRSLEKNKKKIVKKYSNSGITKTLATMHVVINKRHTIAVSMRSVSDKYRLPGFSGENCNGVVA